MPARGVTGLLGMTEEIAPLLQCHPVASDPRLRARAVAALHHPPRDHPRRHRAPEVQVSPGRGRHNRAVPAPRVLVVEDDAAIRDSVTAALVDEGYVVQACADGRQLDAVTAGFRPDLALLDVMLPGPDGFALARKLRGSSDLPVVFLTARDAIGDRLQGFGVGADDYVVKPFSIEELLARVRSVLRRSGRSQSEVWEIGDLVVDRAAGVASRAGHPLALTATELRLLDYLIRNRGRTLSKLQILTQVWGYDAYDPNLVEVHVSAVRRKLEAHGDRLLHTVRGLGYVLRPSDDACR